MSYTKQENINESKNRRNTFRIKDTIQDPAIWFNELYNINSKLKKIKEKYEYDMKANAFDLLPEEYKSLRISCNVKISKRAYK